MATATRRPVTRRRPAAKVVAPAEAAPAPAPAEKSKDIGNWVYKSWRGHDMWAHPNGQTTFDRKEARRLRRL